MKTGLWQEKRGERCQPEPKAVFLSQMSATQPENPYLILTVEVISELEWKTSCWIFRNIWQECIHDRCFERERCAQVITLGFSSSVRHIAASCHFLESFFFCSRMRFLLQVVTALFIARLSIPSALLTRLLRRCFTKASSCESYSNLQRAPKSSRRGDQRVCVAPTSWWSADHMPLVICAGTTRSVNLLFRFIT